MVKKQFLVGVGLVALLATSSFPLLRRAHAQQDGAAAPSASAPRPVTFEVRDKGVLRNLIHAEGGRDKSTNTLQKVTLLTLDASGQVIAIVRADSMEVKQQGEKTTWVFRKVNLDKLALQEVNVQQVKVRIDTMSITGEKLPGPLEEAAVPGVSPNSAH